MAQNDRYLKLMNFDTPEDAYKAISKWTSNLSQEEHTIRSCIFDMHAQVEIELKRIFYHHFKKMLFYTDDETHNQRVKEDFDKMIEKLGFRGMHEILHPIFKYWPYPELGEDIKPVNEVRNRAAHRANIDEVLYKGRSPFKDMDCLAELYFDVWALGKCFRKFFSHTISRPEADAKYYYGQYEKYLEKYGPLDTKESRKEDNTGEDEPIDG